MTGPFDLSWLLPAPADLRSKLRAVLSAEAFDEWEVRKLAAFALSLRELDALTGQEGGEAL